MGVADRGPPSRFAIGAGVDHFSYTLSGRAKERIDLRLFGRLELEEALADDRGLAAMIEDGGAQVGRAAVVQVAGMGRQPHEWRRAPVRAGGQDSVQLQSDGRGEGQ